MDRFIILTKYDRNRYDDIDHKVHVNASMIAVYEATGPSTSVVLQNVLEPLHVRETPEEITSMLAR